MSHPRSLDTATAAGRPDREGAEAMRAVVGAVIGIVALLLLLSAGVGGSMLGGGSAASGCIAAGVAASSAAIPSGSPPTLQPGAGGRLPPIGRWSSEQAGNAAVIIQVGASLQIPPRGWVIAVATAMQESSLIDTPGGDDDSVGLFQQRPSQGWGSPAQLLDPQYAATKFYQKLQTISGWQTMPLTEAAQQVQRSAYPDAYAKWEADATQLVTALAGPAGLTGPIQCTVAVGVDGWTQPVHGHVGSGFRTPGRPTHNGVDLIVSKGTPIHAAAAGTVTTVRCNAVDVRTGADWGCDRDGNPELTRGCGWYVDIEHTGPSGLIVTRYCHQLVRPYVTVGQHVQAGDIIGVAGSSGRSSGPHVHFEVHLGDHSSATAVDPVAFMASVHADLHQ
jgi:murein DD-endopeptidase MepM/ murein hydrolase activator NlpD